jgi:hypothetical protein
MRILQVVVWTVACVAAGIVLKSSGLSDRAFHSLNGAWKSQSPRLERAKSDAQDLVEDMKRKAASDSSQPKERHSKEDKQAIEQLISKRSKG